MKCLTLEDDELSRRIIEQFIEQTDFLELSAGASFGNPVDAAAYLRENAVDLVLVDIELPVMTGLEFINTLNKKPYVILITAKEEYAVESYEYEVVDYLLKPISYARFLKAVTKVKEMAEQKPQSNDAHSSSSFLFVKDGSRLQKVVLHEILFVEAEGDYVAIHKSSGTLTVYSTMKHIESKLPESDFARVHRSYIVRIDKIADITDNNLIVGKKIIPIGASYKQALIKRLNVL